MKPVESLITLPSQARFVAPALAFIRAVAASCGFSDHDLNNIELAAEEALTNVIEHAFEGNAEETFNLSVRFTETDFFITIFEKGIPFNPDKVAHYDPVRFVHTLEADGLGVYLMKNMMDDVRFENLGREGKSLTLVKHMKECQANVVLGNCGNDALVKNRPALATSGEVPYQIRPFSPEDALEISRCAYKAYGYTYEPYIYYPEQIIDMNRTGMLRSFVAASRETGEIMGHVAFKYKNTADTIAEIGVAFVKPEYRMSGVFNSLMHFSHEKAAAFGLAGIFGRAVTSHIGSQKVADAMGYSVCGLFLGLFPDDVDFKALSGKVRQKESGLLLYRPILAAGERSIYLPLHHESTVLGMFRAFNIPVRAMDAISGPATGKSRIDVEIIPVLNSANVEVTAIGKDIVPELESIIHDLCLKHVDAIFLHFDMEAPGTPFVVQQCERAGFFFSGVLPFGLNNRHALILQYMNNLAVDYDIIKPYSQSGVDILQYVRSCNLYRTGDQTLKRNEASHD